MYGDQDVQTRVWSFSTKIPHLQPGPLCADALELKRGTCAVVQGCGGRR